MKRLLKEIKSDEQLRPQYHFFRGKNFDHLHVAHFFKVLVLLLTLQSKSEKKNGAISNSPVQQ